MINLSREVPKNERAYMLCFAELCFELRLLAIDGPSTHVKLVAHDGELQGILIEHGGLDGFEIAKIVWNEESARLEASPCEAWDMFPKTAPKNPAEFTRIFEALGIVVVEG